MIDSDWGGMTIVIDFTGQTGLEKASTSAKALMKQEAAALWLG
jgi:hypothetical protein